MITIVDYGMGNLGSVLNMLKRAGCKTEIAGDPDGIRNAEKLILPGVGNFDSAVRKIRSMGIWDVLDYKATDERIPLLGICLGMQLLTRSSEEGELDGFGWIGAAASRFPTGAGIKVPHMGWNVVIQSNESLLTKDLPSDARFYFVHSYFVKVDDSSDSILKATHGVTFDAAIQHDNIFGAQFHPEKSHRFGMQLLKNFSDL